MLVSIIASNAAKLLAYALARRFERNLGVQMLVIAGSQAPITQIWEEGSHAEAMLLLLDAASAQGTPDREAWQGILSAMRSQPICFGLLEPCHYPQLLKRGAFFDASRETPFARNAEVWIAKQMESRERMHLAPTATTELESWWQLLVDQPGHLRIPIENVDAAQTFAAKAARHFQNVLWIPWAGRSLDSVQGELEHRAPCGRTLAIFTAAPETPCIARLRNSDSLLELVSASGGDGPCSTVFPAWFADQVAGADPWRGSAIPVDEASRLFRLAPGQSLQGAGASSRHLSTLCITFQDWRKDQIRCRELLYELPAAIAYGLDTDWPAAGALCWHASLWLLAEGRKREARELLALLHREAAIRGDDERASDAAAELSWLEDKPLLQLSASPAEQLGLF